MVYIAQLSGAIKMLQKINALVAILELKTFDVEALAKKADVNAVTARTILARLPKSWFRKRAAPSGKRGGQPQVWTLTAAGRAGILEDVGRLPTMPGMPRWREDVGKLLPKQRWSRGGPLGLRAAENALARAEAASPTVAAHLLKQAEKNLHWAKAELEAQEELESHSGHQGFSLARLQLDELWRRVENMPHRRAANKPTNHQVGKAAQEAALNELRRRSQAELEEFSNWRTSTHKPEATSEPVRRPAGQRVEQEAIPMLASSSGQGQLAQAVRLMRSLVVEGRAANAERSLLVELVYFSAFKHARETVSYLRGALDALSDAKTTAKLVAVEWDMRNSKNWEAVGDRRGPDLLVLIEGGAPADEIAVAESCIKNFSRAVDAQFLPLRTVSDDVLSGESLVPMRDALT